MLSCDLNTQGRTAAIVVCWFLGNGSLIAWNSMLTIVDYYVKVFPVWNSLNSFLAYIYAIFFFWVVIVLLNEKIWHCVWNFVRFNSNY